MGDEDSDRREWPVAMAEVTACHYDVRAGRALAFGLTSDKHFRIDYNYRVSDELHTGQCFSEIARPQRRVPLLAIGVVGSIVLLLAYLFFLRGCS